MRAIILFTTAFLIIGCGRSSSDKAKNIATGKIVLSQDEQEVVNKVKELLTWYKANYKDLNSFDLVPNANGKGSLQYRVNFAECDKLIGKFSASGYFTKNALEGLNAYFKKCDEDMVNEKQNDGPPDGLEGDFILCTQEIDESLAKIETATYKDVTINNNEAKLTVTLLYDLPVQLKKENNEWKISKICRIGSK
jgi:hypothetical protein